MDIVDKLAECEEAIEEFNIIIKCLPILLDDKLVQTALLGTSFIRALTNYNIHRKHEFSEHVKDALTRLADLDSDPYGDPVGWDGKDSAEFDDLSEQSNKIFSWLSLREDYMFADSTVVETLVDEHLRKRFDNDELFGNNIAIWKWLEFSAPVPN